MPQTAEKMKEFIMALILMCSYSIIQLTLVGIGIFVFVRAIKEKAIRIDRSPEIAIPRERAAGAVLKNAGAILFLIICSITMVISLFVK